MRLKTNVLVAVVTIAVLMLTLGVPTAAAQGTDGSPTGGWGGHTIVVVPNGVNDTADIQAAFNTCTSQGWTCTIQLVKGTYYTDQVTAYGFRGVFAGAGQGRTVIQALPNLPSPNPAYNTSTVPFWAGLPGPTNPWPVLFTFVNGAFGVSGMTITDTYANPSQGWNYLGYAYTTLWSAILVTGQSGQFVTASVNQVTINGGPGMNAGFNDNDMVAFEGLLLPAGWTDPFGDMIPLTGWFSVTNSVFHNVSTGPFFWNLLDSIGVACYDSVSTSASMGVVLSVPFAFYDLSNTQLMFCGNRAVNVPVGAAVIGYQSVFHSNLLPSTVYVVGNYFRDVNSAADGVFLWDQGSMNYGVASTLTAVISGNYVQTDTSCGCYGGPPLPNSAIFTISLVSAVVTDNFLNGGAGVIVAYGGGAVSGNTILRNIQGVELYGATGVSVTGNLIKETSTYGIALTNGSSDNLVKGNLVRGSGLYDLYWDGTGTDNTWAHNICKTSSPPGLC